VDQARPIILQRNCFTSNQQQRTKLKNKPAPMGAYENNLEVSNQQRTLSFKPLSAARFSNSDQVIKKQSNQGVANQQMLNEVMLQATYG
jgi:hypothetical protein